LGGARDEIEGQFIQGSQNMKIFKSLETTTSLIDLDF